jgi:hypothetical protein
VKFEKLGPPGHFRTFAWGIPKEPGYADGRCYLLAIRTTERANLGWAFDPPSQAVAWGCGNRFPFDALSSAAH